MKRILCAQMTGYLLDTNIVSLIRTTKPRGAVLAWLQGLRDDQIHISAVTLGELQRGIERARKQDKTKALEIESWVDQLQATHNVLPMDAACFREAARLIEGKSKHLLEDAIIAAIARVHGLKVATRNTADFAHLGVDILNPFLR